MTKKIALFGPYGFGNMGDAALVEAAKYGLKKMIPEAEICGICQHPGNVIVRHKMPAYSIYREYPKGVAIDLGEEGQSLKTSAVDKNDTEKPEGFKFRIKKILKSNRYIYLSLKIIRRLVEPLLLVLKVLIFNLKILRLLKSLDAIVMPGSGQLNEEWGGAWKYPFALFKWCLFARLMGCKIAMLSVGSGTVKTFWGRLFCRLALLLSHYRSYRDPKTKALAESLHIYQGDILPDLAFSLDTQEALASAEKNAEVLTVGINIIAFCDPRSWYRKDEAEYRKYVEKMVKITIWLIESGFRVNYIPNEIRMDNWVIDDIFEMMPGDYIEKSLLVRSVIRTPIDILSNISACNFMLASRFHGLLFSLLLKKPVITIAFHYKLTLLAKDMGQHSYCLDIEKFSFESFVECFEKLVKNEASISREIENIVKTYPHQLESQYKQVASLLT